MNVPTQKTSLKGAVSTLLYLKQFVILDNTKAIIKLLSALFMMLLMIGLNVGVPLIFRQIITNLSLQAHPSIWIIMLLIAYGLTWSISQISSQVKQYLVTDLLEDIISRFSLRLFDHLHSLSLRFHLQRKTGAVSNAITRSYHGLESLFWGLVLFLIPTFLEIVFAITVITYLFGFFYGAAIAMVLIVYSTASIIGLELSQKAHEIQNEKRSATKAFMIDSLINFETVKYFSNHYFEHKECKKILEGQRSSARAVNKQAVLLQLAQSLIIGLGLACITWFAGNEVMKGTLRVSDFVLINSYVLQFVMPLSYLGYVLQQIRKGFIDISDSITLLETKPEIVDMPDAVSIVPQEVTIEFKHVSFGFDASREILHDISFSIPSGNTVAFVGPTGSGKSTIARLIYRMYDITKGEILINGHSIKEVSQNSLHALIGIVSQDTMLFNNTLYYNIAYGDPSASREEVLAAAHAAHLTDFIKRLPLGVETVVGERGLMISGGEKQRIAIARAILKKPLVYVFDEATSALDTRTEKEIQQKIREVSETATTMIIAHRLSTVVDADEIVVLDRGVIVEKGTHAKLLENNSLYAALWREQSQDSSSEKTAFFSEHHRNSGTDTAKK